MERKIGEIFQDGDVTLKVVEDNELPGPCIGCHYPLISYQCVCQICCWSDRKDKKSVKFIKQDQP